MMFPDLGANYLFIAVAALALILVATLMFLASRYRRCPSDRILVVFGKIGAGKSARCLHGGGAFIWPLIQDFGYLSLTPMTISIPLQGALSFQNIRVNVPSTFTVGISTDEAIMANAAERLLGLGRQNIEDMAREIIFGQLRLTVASLTIEQINQDRESFLEAIRRNVEPELNKIGLNLINVNITDITDESNYIESIGKKAAAEAIEQARIDVAIQQKAGAIGQAEAQKEREIRVAENMAEAEKGKKGAEADQRIRLAELEAQAVAGENASRAVIAARNAELAVKQAQALQESEVAEKQAQAEIQRAQYLAEAERLKALEIVQQETEKTKMEIAAAAEAEQARLKAQGEADATAMRYQAEAEGLQKLLAGKAHGYELLVKAAQGNAQNAAALLLIEKLEEIAKLQAEAIKNIKFDKVTVWDSGSGEGSSTANFMSNLIKSLPPLHDIARMAGLQMPEYLGSLPQQGSNQPESRQKPAEKPKSDKAEA